MSTERRNRYDLQSRIIDVHSHVGVHDDMYKSIEYPCCQSIEGLYYRQLAGGIGVNVVFPFGNCPHNSYPYEIDNLRLLKEVYEFCSELSDRFLPFLCMDTFNQVATQISAANRLARTYPIYGIKINPVDVKVHVNTLHQEGKAILDFASEHDIPLIFHAVPRGMDGYSCAEDIMDIAEANSHLRFCLAHCLLFRKDLLDRADALPNVWVDTAALKIQCELTSQRVNDGAVDKNELIEGDLNDHLSVMRKLVNDYPQLMVWGSDSPAYAFNTRRQQASGEFYDFRLKGRYEDEVAALRCLSTDLQKSVAGKNVLDFIFG